MKKPTGKNSQIALLNEYKGNLFEFMVAHELSRIIKCESEFMGAIAPNFHQLLRTYQQYIYAHDTDLAHFLTEYARPCAEFIIQEGQKQFSHRFSHSFSKVNVMGKVVANDTELTHEGDILLSHESHIWPISLKIAKKGSYLNTKSAGMRSCLSRYFKSQVSQEKLNYVQDIEFTRLSRELETIHNLAPSDDFSSWKNTDLSTRPGELQGDSRKALEAYYLKILECLELRVKDILSENQQLFMAGIRELAGFQSDQITQIVAFHQGHKDAYFKAHNANILKNEIPQISRESGSTSLYLETSKWRLQLRVKPMNAFTTKAIKLNCSIRYL